MTKHGIGGWLLVPALCTVLIPCGLLASFIDTFSAYGAIWERRSETPLAHLALIAGEQAGNMLLVICWFVALYLLLRKSNRYPAFSSICAAGPLTLAILVAVIGAIIYQKPIPIGKLISWLVMAGIIAGWCAYMRLSKRVANTFVAGRIDEA